MIDMHCHLDLYPNPLEVARQCKQRNIYVLSVTTTPKAWIGTQALATGCDRIRTSLGLHPQLVHERYHEIDLFDELLPQAKYVGEIGLDGSKEYAEHRDVQIRTFKLILERTEKAGGRIMSIHSRSAADSVLDCLALHQDIGIPILHWFSGTKVQLKRAISMGCWFSVNPTMLSTKKGSSLIAEIPRERILTETDGPFTKLDRQSLMPWDVEKAQLQLSYLWEIDPKQTEFILFSNLKSLVGNSV
jgi:TatD DNase family protein